MKNVIAFVVFIMAFTACNNADTGASKSSADSTSPSTAKLDYPYTIEHPDGWERGDPKNSVMVLKSLKAYENGNIDECVFYFGDSVLLEFDQYEQKVTKDSLKAMFTRDRGGYKSYEIRMDDWESVISPDKKYEYVTLWYKQKWEDQSGKKDSCSVSDDLRIKDGKIVSIDEKRRRYALKKM